MNLFRKKLSYEFSLLNFDLNILLLGLFNMQNTMLLGVGGATVDKKEKGERKNCIKKSPLP